MYIIHLGVSCFPANNATAQRIRFTFKAVKEAGYTPLIINKQSIYSNLVSRKRVSTFDGLIFLYSSPLLERPNAFAKRNINKLRGIISEFFLLYKKRKQIDSAILYTPYFSDLVYYRILSKILRFKLVIQYVEYLSCIGYRDSFFTKINDKLFDKHCSKLCDGVIAISEFLKNEVHKIRPGVPILKIPAICDFNDFEPKEELPLNESYFLYCGAVEYIPVIQFIITFFEKAKSLQLFEGKLVCIIGCNSSQNFDEIDKLFEKSEYFKDIILYKNLQYGQIIPLYKKAELLLIPLRNNIQDIARFPHKVSEYTASRRPLLSTDIGELKYYFTAGKSALLAQEYDVDMYVETLQKLKQAGGSFDSIGDEGYKVGYKYFHYPQNIQSIKSFFKSL
jgi:glycosyltransferase involved in cell wall biosynthesis